MVQIDAFVTLTGAERLKLNSIIGIQVRWRVTLNKLTSALICYRFCLTFDCPGCPVCLWRPQLFEVTGHRQTFSCLCRRSLHAGNTPSSFPFYAVNFGHNANWFICLLQEKHGLNVSRLFYGAAMLFDGQEERLQQRYVHLRQRYSAISQTLGYACHTTPHTQNNQSEHPPFVFLKSNGRMRCFLWASKERRLLKRTLMHHWTLMSENTPQVSSSFVVDVLKGWISGNLILYLRSQLPLQYCRALKSISTRVLEMNQLSRDENLSYQLRVD